MSEKPKFDIIIVRDVTGKLLETELMFLVDYQGGKDEKPRNFAFIRVIETDHCQMMEVIDEGAAEGMKLIWIEDATYHKELLQACDERLTMIDERDKMGRIAERN